MRTQTHTTESVTYAEPETQSPFEALLAKPSKVAEAYVAPEVEPTPAPAPPAPRWICYCGDPDCPGPSAAERRLMGIPDSFRGW